MEGELPVEGDVARRAEARPSQPAAQERSCNPVVGVIRTKWVLKPTMGVSLPPLLLLLAHGPVQ